MGLRGGGCHRAPSGRVRPVAISCALLFAVVIGVVVGVNDVNHPRVASPSSASGLPGAEPTVSGPMTPAVTAPPGALVPVPSPMPKSVPVRVEIPAIGVDSTLVRLGLQADGTLQVPPAGFPAGWYSGAPTPGERGPAIIVGHVDWAGRAGVFYRLHNLKPNDEIIVVRADGSTAMFRVIRVQQFPKDQFPTALVYGNLNYAGLRLITCSGAFDQLAHSYQDDTVVFAQLANSSPA